MEKNESYRHALPHFQQPGQAYFVTWCLKDAVPPKALVYYSKVLDELQIQIKSLITDKSKEQEINDLKIEQQQLRKKYMKAFDDLLHLETSSIVNLSKQRNTQILFDAITFWEGVKLENYAFCIMSNHVHWVFRVFEKDPNGEPVYLQDILQSVKSFTANKINEIENRTGQLWQKESYDTTIRNERHLYNAVRYTIMNPVNAGIVENWNSWKGTRLADNMWDF